MNASPRYMIRKHEILIRCEDAQSLACAELILSKDMDGGKNSLWWGHPEFVSDSLGVTTVKLPLNVHNLSLLHKCGARALRSDTETMSRVSFFVRNKHTSTSASHLPLKPFQVEGLEWLNARDLRAILAYKMGLGKTLTSIATLLSNPELYLPAIIIAPAHVKLNWAGEWVKWGGNPDEIVVLFGRTPKKKEIESKKLIVLNQHILAGWIDTLIDISPKALIVDEAHSFVNSKTKTYPLAERLARVCSRRVLLLTATPLVNDLSDLWGLCNLINNDILGLKKVFADTFMPEEAAKQKMFASRWRGSFAKTGWAAVGRAKLPKAVIERRIDELGDVLRRTVMLCKSKQDVMTELPPIVETRLKLDIPETTPEGAGFWEIENRCVEEINEAKADVLSNDKLLPAFTLVRRNAATAKVPYVADWLNDFMKESDEDEKIVVVGWSVEPLETLHKQFRKQSLLINGSVNAQKKKVIQSEFFDNPEKRILFGNIKSIGSGIDLDVAKTMLFVELPLTGVDFEQAKGRIDRPSKALNSLSYYYMTIKGSYEDTNIWKIVNRKQDVTSKLGM